MSTPQHISYQVGGLLSLDLPGQPANAVVSCYQGDGTVVFTGQNATVSSVNTTLGNACSKDDRAINVAANTSIASGMVLHLCDDEEAVLVKSVAGLTVKLRSPVLYDHVNAATVQSARLTYQANSDHGGALFWDGRVCWNINGGEVIHYTAVECTKYPLTRITTAQDVRDVYPEIYLEVGDADMERLLDLGHEYVLSRIASAAPDLRARVYPGSTEFKTSVALAVLKYHYMRRSGEAARDLYERYSRELDQELDRVTQVTPRDTDQDGVVEADERISMRSVTLVRA